MSVAKGTVEPGRVKRIGVSWLPPADFGVSDSPHSTALPLEGYGNCFHPLRGAIQKLLWDVSAEEDDRTQVAPQGNRLV